MAKEKPNMNVVFVGHVDAGVVAVPGGLRDATLLQDGIPPVGGEELQPTWGTSRARNASDCVGERKPPEKP